MVHRISILLVILIISINGVAQVRDSEMPHHYVSPFKSTPPLIDGSLDDHFWEGVSWTENFQDIEGSIRPQPAYVTRVKMAYTEKALYIGAFIEDPHIWATLTEKNQPIYRYDKNFEVFIDPDGDHCNYYELEMNAMNTIWELTLPYPYRNGGKPINPDNLTGMKSAVNIQGTLNDPSDIDDHWTVEIEIPFEEFSKYGSVNIPPADGDMWRINFSRVQWAHIINGNAYIKHPSKSEDNWVWTPQHQVNMHAPEQWGFLHFNKINNPSSQDEEWKTECQLVEYVMNQKNLPRNSNTQISTFNKDTFYILNQEIQHFINRKTCYWKKKINE